MTQPLNVHLLPSLMEASSLRGGTAVIIDILRASSTMITALHNGAMQVIPCGTPDAARRIREELGADAVLLGGERGGVRIEGFECGNSPLEFPAARVAGKTIAFTTTNGTHALLQAAAANTILIGAFVNRQAVVERLHSEHQSIHLVCAGTDGEITGEDVLFAGAIVEKLLKKSELDSNAEARWQLNDSARIALGFWLQTVGNQAEVDSGDEPHRIALALRDTRGGRNLLELGYDPDIRLCSMVDTIGIVPILDAKSQSLVTAIDS